MAALTQQQMADFLTLYAAAQAAQAVQAPATRNKSAVAKPREYDGGAEFIEFRREILVYIAATPDMFPADTDKIFFTLSFMKSGTASTWAQNYVDEFTANGLLALTDTWEQFGAKLNAAFEDPNRATNALKRFRTMVQGSMTADEFFVQFDIIHSEASLTAAAHDPLVIDCLQHALNPDVVKGVMRSAVVPVTYQGWKTKACEVDKIERQIKEVTTERRQSNRSWSAAQPAPAIVSSRPQENPRIWSAPNHPPPAQQQRPTQPTFMDSYNVPAGTHPGLGIPMDQTIGQMR